jgi:hypothetical protein
MSSAPIAQLGEPILRSVPPGPHRSVLFEIPPDGPWEPAASVAAILVRDGVGVHVNAAWEFMFGPERHATGHETVRFLWARPGLAPSKVPSGASALATLTTGASLGGTTVYRLAGR